MSRFIYIALSCLLTLTVYASTPDSISEHPDHRSSAHLNSESPAEKLPFSFTAGERHIGLDKNNANLSKEHGVVNRETDDILSGHSSKSRHASEAETEVNESQTLLSERTRPTTQDESNNVMEEESLGEADDIDSKDAETDALYRATKIKQIRRLRQKSRDLQDLLQVYHREQDDVSVDFEEALQRRQTISKSRDYVERLRRKVEYDLDEYHRQMPYYKQTLQILQRRAKDAVTDIGGMQRKQTLLLRQKARLVEEFRRRGLEHWVESLLKDTVSPFLTDAFVQGTANVVEPVLDGIGKLAEVNDDLTRRMSTRLRNRVPLVEKPFYSGFVTYTVLLCPLVLVISILMKIKRGLAKLTTGHIMILGNFYFGVLSGGCFVATILGSVDVLLTFRRSNIRMFDFIMAVHGLLFIVHILLHVSFASRFRDRTSLTHIALLLTLGLHFFIHSYRHALRHEDPDVDKHSYIFYTCIFFYALYGLTIKHIRKMRQDDIMTLNNKSIGANANLQTTNVTAFPSSSGSPGESLVTRDSNISNIPVERSSALALMHENQRTELDFPVGTSAAACRSVVVNNVSLHVGAESAVTSMDRAAAKKL